ncbi:unnamed protein product, partial [Allacma fusca]
MEIPGTRCGICRVWAKRRSTRKLEMTMTNHFR